MFWNRIIRILKLDVAVFEEIEHDPNANNQAFLVVALVSVVTALGAAIGASFSDRSFWITFFAALLWTPISWFIWSGIAYLVGVKIFDGVATFREMLRVIGFAYAPLMISIIPFIGGLIGAIWALVAGFLALRQGLDLTDINAFLTLVVGFTFYVLGVILLNDLITVLRSLLV